MKKSVKLISSVVVLAALCGVYAGVKVYVNKMEKEESEVEDTTENIFSISSEDIRSLTFFVDKNEVTFEKDGDNWIKSDDKEFPVEQSILDDATSVICSIYSQRTIEDVDDLSQYGLDDPINTVTVQTEDESNVFRFGMENTTTGQYYMRMNDEETIVYLVDSSVTEPFMKTLYDFAQSDSFPDISSDSIKKIQVNGENGSYILKKEDDSGFWCIGEDKDAEKADSAKSSSLTSYLSSLEYGSFVNYDSDDLSVYGLDKPYADIIVDYTEEQQISESTDEGDVSDDEHSEIMALEEDDDELIEIAEPEEEESEEELIDDEEISEEENEQSETITVEKQVVIHIGDEAPDDSRYVTVDDSTAVYTVSNESLSSIIDMDESNFWDLTVCYLSVNQLSSIKVSYNGTENTVDVSRETSETEDGEETETLSYKMNGNSVDSTEFTSFYNKLINMAGARRLTEEYETNSNVSFEAVLKDLNGNTIDVQLSEYDVNYYAASVENITYLVNKMTVKDVISAYESLTGEDEKSETEDETEINDESE